MSFSEKTIQLMRNFLAFQSRQQASLQPPAKDSTALASEAEYSIEQLAIKCNTSVRNIRAYQEKGLLEPPRLHGRKGVYSHAHLSRLKSIVQLAKRGYTANAIHELFEALEHGIGLHELMGVESAINSPWSDEDPVTVNVAKLASMFGTALTPHVIKRAAELELISIQGLHVHVPNMSLLHVGKELVDAGIPFDDMLDVLATMRGNVQSMADDFVNLFAQNVLLPYGPDTLPPQEDMADIIALIWRIRPLAETVVKSELARAMDRAAGEYITQKITDIVGSQLKHLSTQPNQTHEAKASASSNDIGSEQAIGSSS